MKSLWNALWNGKWIIMLTTLAFSVAAVVYALSLPNIYKSEVLLTPVAESGGLNLSGQLGSLAAMAGVNLGKDKAGNKSELAFELLKSRDFAMRFMDRHQIAIDLLATKSWDPMQNTLNYDKDIYDPELKKWTREVEPPLTPEPSLQTLYKEFSEIYHASKDKQTGLVKLSIEHPSPYLAKRWLDLIVQDINAEIRQRDLDEAERSIKYLEQKINEAQLAEIKTMLYSLIEEQTKTVVLANVRDEYVLKVIDPAVVPEEKDKPGRALIVVLFFIIGMMLSSLVIVLRFLSQQDK